MEEKWWVTINRAIRLHWKAYLIPSMCPGLWKPYSTWVAVKICICENNVQIHDGDSCSFTSAYSCFTGWMWAALSEVLSYSADLLVGTSCAFMIKSLNSLIFLPYWVVGAKDPSCHVLLTVLLENFCVFLLRGMSNLLYFQILVEALLNPPALWNVEELWISATCSTWGKLRKPSSSV